MGLRTQAVKRWPALGSLLKKHAQQIEHRQQHLAELAGDNNPLLYQNGTRTRGAHSSWYRGEHCNYLPDSEAMAEPDALAKYVGYGWLPAAPFITRTDPITTFGSCFAAHIADYLRKAGFTTADLGRSPASYVIRCGEGMVNTAAVAQQFQWAYGEKEFNEPLWYDKEGSAAEYEENVRTETREIFDSSKVFIVTLGLSEVWYNKETGETFWRAIPRERFDPSRHGFKVLSVGENKENLETSYRLIRQHRPDAAIIFTLSPVPLVATFRPVSCISANTVSKASLRMAVDELMREHPDDPRLFYFPSYEIVKEVIADPYEDDRRHVRPEVVSGIMNFFARHYLIGAPA